MLLKDLDLEVEVLRVALEQRVLEEEYLVPAHVEAVVRVLSAVLFSCLVCDFNVESVLRVLVNLAIKLVYDKHSL